MLLHLVAVFALCGAPERAPLLPEGTIVSNAKARLIAPKAGGAMRLRLVEASAPADNRIREFTVLPSRVLEQLDVFHREQPDSPVLVTGTLTLFDGRNWLLPVHVTQEATAAVRDVPTEVPTLPVDPPAQGPDVPATEPDAGDDESVADIVADLEQAVGQLRKGLRDAPGASGQDQQVADDLVIVSRRGRISRTSGGTWVLLLDADNTTIDPPLVLLPSRVLGEIVDHTRTTGPGAPLLVSGTLQQYKGRRYLVPSGWRVPRERPNLRR